MKPISSRNLCDAACFSRSLLRNEESVHTNGYVKERKRDGGGREGEGEEGEETAGDRRKKGQERKRKGEGDDPLLFSSLSPPVPLFIACHPGKRHTCWGGGGQGKGIGTMQQ